MEATPSQYDKLMQILHSFDERRNHIMTTHVHDGESFVNYRSALFYLSDLIRDQLTLLCGRLDWYSSRDNGALEYFVALCQHISLGGDVYSTIPCTKNTMVELWAKICLHKEVYLNDPHLYPRLIQDTKSCYAVWNLLTYYNPSVESNIFQRMRHEIHCMTDHLTETHVLYRRWRELVIAQISTASSYLYHLDNGALRRFIYADLSSDPIKLCADIQPFVKMYYPDYDPNSSKRYRNCLIADLEMIANIRFRHYESIF